MNGHTNGLPPVEPLPQPQLTRLGDGVSLLLPLSRRGTGPGIILIVPDDLVANVDIREGVPSPLVKWAEESYTAVAIASTAIKQDAEAALRQAHDALADCSRCEPKGQVGLVNYDASAWESVASLLGKGSKISGAVVYGDVDTSFVKVAVPTVQHLSGKPGAKLERTNDFISYDYPQFKSGPFATPFQDSFNYAAEAVSHTRNLTFLKRHMNGPYFDLEAIWDEHTYYEFENRSVEHTMSTMVQEPYVNHIPTMTGGIGRENLTNFYQNHFIFKNSADTELELVSRTVGIDRVIDEFIFKLTHDGEVDWLIPGVPPTGKKLEIPMGAVVNIRGDRLYHEHISWDQTSVLRQLGLLPEYLPFPYPLPDGRKPGPGKRFEYRLPVAGVETANKMRDKNSFPSNGMFDFKVREV